MRTHLQGILVLGLVAAALWGSVQLASPALSEALGDNGAVRAASGDADTVDLTVDAPVEPLTDQERVALQFGLLVEGFLTDQGDVDGIFGPKTRDAIDRAAQAWGLDEPSDREVLEYVQELLAGNPFFQKG